jgi:ABC-type nitrate/sulfonate/bicarbonate transport system substrate-binding protein
MIKCNSSAGKAGAIRPTITTLRGLAAGLLLAAALGAGLPAVAGTPDTYQPAQPEAGTDVPQADVKFGMRPYADNTFYIIAMKKGWFKDVGIHIQPAPYGLQVTDQNVNSLVLNGQVDLTGAMCPIMLPTYKASSTVKCIALTDNYVADSILANPRLKLKTFNDYIKEGMNFADAMHATLAPLEGKQLVTTPLLSQQLFQEGMSNFAKVKWGLQVMDDSKQLVLAKQNRIDFANPGGAPIVYSLLQDGWTQLVSMREVSKYGPGGADSPVEPLVAIPGMAGNRDYILKNPNTVLRFLSVVYRTLDAVKKDPSLYDLQAPYLNSVAGTSLDGKGVAATINTLDPFTSFDDAKTYYADPQAATYYKSVYGALIKNYEANGILPKGAVTPDDFVWGAAIWKQMVDYRDKTKTILDGLGDGTLDTAHQQLANKARQYYDWYDYLDAFRLASAAAQ